MYKFRIIFLLLIFSCSRKMNSDDSYQEENPKTFSESIIMLEKKFDVNELSEFKNLDEDEAVLSQYRYRIKSLKDTSYQSVSQGNGVYIRNIWLKEPELLNFFRFIGIPNREDMSVIIIRSLHRKLNNKELNLKKQVEYYKEYWEKTEKLK